MSFHRKIPHNNMYIVCQHLPLENASSTPQTQYLSGQDFMKSQIAVSEC